MNANMEKLGKVGLNLKQKQLEALSSVVQKKNDTIFLLPTGFGKSLIYQLLPFMFDFYQPEERNVSSSSFVLVLSPLNALMMDQISKLKDHVNVCIMKAVYTDESHNINFQESVGRDTKIIYAHPEALLEDKRMFERIMKSRMWKENLKVIVVDEAHLVDEW